MPFVQRVVSPTFISRSRPRSRVYQNGPAGLKGGSPPVRPPKTAPKTSAGSPNNGDVIDDSVLNNVNGCESAPHGSKVTFIGPGNVDTTDFVPRISSVVVATSKTNNNVNGSPDTKALEGGYGGAGCSVTGHAGSIVVVPLPAPLTISCRPASPSPVVTGHEFDSVTNITLSNALRQLASLVLIANDIFSELNEELQAIGDRSKGIKERIVVLERKVEQYDPKSVPVPESDLETFVHIKNHFKSKRPIDKGLFTPETRSSNLRQLYEAAARTSISSTGDSNEYGGVNGEMICTPVLGQRQRKMRSRIDVEIETRLPAAVEELRKWTSSEALGDITVTPDCISRVGHSTSLMNNSTMMSSGINVNGQQYDSDVSPVSPSRIAQQSQQRCVTAADHHSIDVTDDNSNSTVIGAAQHSSSGTSNNYNRTVNEDDDLPLDHRLPSPEEQCQIIALKFPAEVVPVDVTGRRFQRMCNARKSMTNCIQIGDENNLNDDVQTVRRRTRSRKPRGKRRNTIAGTDRSEIEEAANGESQSSPSHNIRDVLASSKVGRSKSSDLLKKDSPPSALSTAMFNGTNGNIDAGKTSLTRFNSLKQWGRNRLRWMQRSDEKESDKERDKDKDKVLDIDIDGNVCETVIVGGKNNKKKILIEKERKLSHERKPSYSSSERSLSIISHPVNSSSAANAASINPVKMRETSSLRRQRRNSGLDQKDEPHSSSGNWSASSESGRTSIGSEITVQPKSSASSTSLNHSNLHSGSGPPSSIISRRRFLNTSASSSVTSEGTATPDLQMHDLFYDDETSSAYSCDTEGYYTSFHVDSGLKTLKEEEPMTPLHCTSALSSTTSFSSTINQTVLTAESEYELFGRGSTSTTTSSAGTVCTTLMATDTDRSSLHGPAVPERKSSLTKLNRSNSNASSGTLERSYSSSTVGSTLERSGTIKRNGVLIQKEVAAVIHQEKIEKQQKTGRIDSPDSGNNTSSSPIETNSNDSPTQGLRSTSEFEYSECSDLEGVDRIERIRVKTAINSSRIPSMCIITPTTSDDEATRESSAVRNREKIGLPRDLAPTSSIPPPPQETDLDAIDFETASSLRNNNPDKVQIANDEAGYAVISVVADAYSKSPELRKDANFNNFRKTTLQPLNTMLGKLKGVLPHLKKSSPNKEANAAADCPDESLYDTAGEYVTIADVRNNNNNLLKRTTGKGIYYSNDIVKRNLATVLSGNLNQETEYVSLNELPCSIRCDNNSSPVVGNILAPIGGSNGLEPCRGAAGEGTTVSLSPGTGATVDSIPGKGKKADQESGARIEREQQSKLEQSPQIRGARVSFDAQGKIIYNSDSLKRRKGAHTTFAPGPCVKDPTTSALSSTAAATSSPSDSSNLESVAKNSIASGGTLVRKQDLLVRPVVSQKANLVAATVSQNVDMATDVLSGRYIREKPESLAGDRNIAFSTLQQPTSSSVAGTAYHFEQYDAEDYQRLSHNDRYMQYERQRTAVFEPDSQLIANAPNAGYCKTGRYPPVADAMPFQRNNHIYWTLQHRRQSPAINAALPKDDSTVQVSKGNINVNDLYATPNKIRNRDCMKTTPLGFSSYFSPIRTNECESKISPIDPRNITDGGGFKTSTPSKTESPSKGGHLADELRQRLYMHDGTRSYNVSPSSSGRSTPLRGFVEQHQPRLRHSWAPENPEVPKICSDRFGTQKTSLMDFKKLLLAKSTKTTTKKLSAVEQLKLKRQECQSPATTPPPSIPVLNTSMNILELSGSPKAFACRRNLRPGNYGSPSKTLATKPRSSAAWRVNASRTDVMSTAIPEANSEEDASSNNSSNGSLGRRSPGINKISNLITQSPQSTSPIPPIVASLSTEKTIIDDKINFKTNIFLQTEENNFMKSEMKNPSGLTRSQLAQARAQFLMAKRGGALTNNAIEQAATELYRNPLFDTANANIIPANISVPLDGDDPKTETAMPSLETAL